MSDETSVSSRGLPTSASRAPYSLREGGTGSEDEPLSADRATSVARSPPCLFPLSFFCSAPRSHSFVPAALSTAPARAAFSQGWRFSATARLVLDGREHDG